MRRQSPKIQINQTKWLSFAYHSDACRTIAFSSSLVVVALQFGASLRNTVNIYLSLSGPWPLWEPLTTFERPEMIKQAIMLTDLQLAFLGFLVRYSWLVWQHNSSTARGVDLVLQLGEIGCVLWLWAMPLPLAAWFPGAAVLDSCTVYFLYIPPAFFLVVTKILDAVRFDRGIWLGLQVATRSVPQAKKYRRNRMASTSPRLITVRLYLAFIIVHAASLVGVYIPSLRWETLAQGDGTVTSVFIILASLLVSLVHHLLGLFFTWFPSGLDFGLILLEISLANVSYVGTITQVSSPLLVVANMSERLLISLLLAFRIWDIMQNRTRPSEKLNLVPNYNIQSSRTALLLGRNTWEKLSLRGEPAFIKSLRGILVIAALAGLAAFSAIIISRNVSSSQDEITIKTFTLTSPRSLDDYYGSQYVLLSHAEATSATTVLEHPEIIQVTQTCTPGNDVFNCTVCSADYPVFKYHSCWSCLAQQSPATACQVQVQVNFGRGVEIGAFAGPEYAQSMYVSVTCGGVDNSTVGKIPRVALRRNRALEGDVVFYQHEFLRESRFRSFGFGRSNYAIVGEIKSISNDPTYSIPNNISYLKYRYSPTEDVVSIGTREHIDNTVIDALAAIGGIWTFGNGLFALVFGGSLLYFLLGLRPLSRFGLVHLFIRARLRRATREMYPNFHCEGGQPGEAEAGVVSFIRQHLLGVVGDEEEEEKRKQRRRQWEQQRDEMELISFEVSHAFEANPQHLSSTQYEPLLHRNEEY